MIAPSYLERARAVTIAEAAQMLCLKLPRVGEFVGPCPACGGRDRFSINPRKGVWNCRGARGGRDAISLVEHVRAVDFRGAVEFLAGELELAPAPRAESQRPDPASDDDARRRARARALFAETIDIRGTLGEHYLKIERRLGDILDDELALTIRFHPACPFKDDDVLVRSPSLICALRDPRAAMGACAALGETGAIERAFLQDHSHVVAVQRIRLDAAGRKVDRRSLGPMENGVVFCSSIWEFFYAGTATIGEGIETALAARKLGFSGCVALTGADRFKKFEPPHHWGSITGLAENDAASESAWRAVAPRWRAAGHRVRVVAPPVGDANDYLKGAR